MASIATSRTRRAGRRDEGMILPMVLVATVAFTLLVISMAGLVTAGLRYGHVVEERADRLAAADGGLRYGIEKLRSMKDLCTTKAGTGGGNTTIFPPEINGATTQVTCRRVGNDISDIQGWGVIITGANVPSGQDMFLLKGAGGAGNNVKTFRGPVFVADPTRLDFQAQLIIEDGDLYYTGSDCEGGTPPTIPEIDSGYLTFDPSFLRGPVCDEHTWQGLYGSPSKNLPSAQALAAPLPYNDVIFPGCRVFYPGKYTAVPALSSNNYFVSGDYYFENVPFELTHASATFGFPSGTGDTPKVAAPECENAMIYDQNTSGERGGATIWLGGSSHILVDTDGELEIFRRQQNETYLSVYALEANGAGFVRSTYSFKVSTSIPWILESKSGNTNDMAIHGAFWAPYAKMTLGNVTNAAVGQLIGGVTIALLEAQASNSADSFAIGIEGNPIETHFLLVSTATLDGRSTSIRAVVQFRPGDDARPLAINSWRVAG
jgi:hypothetical protein